MFICETTNPGLYAPEQNKKKERIMSNEGIQLVFEDRRGVYIPRDFAVEIIHRKFSGYTWEDVEELERIGNKEDPNTEETEVYWEIWSKILADAEHIDNGYNKWFLYQDGDVFLICLELMTPEEKRNFFGEDFEFDEDSEEEE